MVGIRAIDRKVLRDLWHLRGQVLAISMVLASGVAMLVMSLSIALGFGWTPGASSGLMAGFLQLTSDESLLRARACHVGPTV